MGIEPTTCHAYRRTMASIIHHHITSVNNSLRHNSVFHAVFIIFPNVFQFMQIFLQRYVIFVLFQILQKLKAISCNAMHLKTYRIQVLLVLNIFT